MNQLIKKYLLSLQYERGLSLNTVKSYSSDLNRYKDYLEHRYSISSPNKIYMKHIKSFLSYELKYYNPKLKSEKKKEYDSSTLSRYFSSIRGFHKYLLDENCCDRDPSIYLDRPKLSKKIPDFLSYSEIMRIINSVDISYKFGLRDQSILYVLYSSGLRASEVLKLKLTNLLLDEEFLRLVGKGSKERFVPISKIAINSIRDYVQELRPFLLKRRESSGYLFLNNRGQKLSRMSLWKIVKKYSLEASISKKVSPHTFRHSFATHMIQAGANLRVVQEMLGHSDISTTQIYTHLDKSSLKKVYNQFHPRS